MGFFRTTVTEPSPHNPTVNAAGVDGDFRGGVHNGIVAIASKSEEQYDRDRERNFAVHKRPPKTNSALADQSAYRVDRKIALLTGWSVTPGKHRFFEGSRHDA